VKVTLLNLKKTLINLLQRCDFVENMGTGINKIKTLCRENDNQEPQFVFNDFFTVVFNRKNNLNGELNKGQETVYLYIKKHKGINAKDISDELNIPFSTIDKQVRVLLRKNLIERRGSKKTGGYYAK
jgi:ATP-dependent DNA helicase RecG